jgi:uncharacterized membrane protein
VLIEQVHALVDQFANVLELVGVGIILVGIILATVTFLRDGSRTSEWRSVYPQYRSDIGRGILCGLEWLVGADIISFKSRARPANSVPHSIVPMGK